MDDHLDYDTNDYAEETKNWNRDPTAYLSRYYSLFYKTVTKEQDPLNVDVYVRQSPNLICVVGIANPSADIVKVVMNTDKVGKKVKKFSILCSLLDAQGVTIGHVRANMEGKLLELNDRFLEEGNSLLLNGYHMDTGFIGIIMPKSEDNAVQLRDFMTEEEYKNNLQSSLQGNLQASLQEHNNNDPNLENKSSRCIIS